MGELYINFDNLLSNINHIINEHPGSYSKKNLDNVLRIIEKLKNDRSLVKRPGGMSEEEWNRLPPLEKEYLERVINE